MFNFQKKKAPKLKRVYKARPDGCTCNSRPHGRTCPARKAAKRGAPPTDVLSPQEARPKRQRYVALDPGTEISYAASEKPALVALAETLDVLVPDRARAELELLDNSKTSRRMWNSVEVRKRRRIAAVVADIARAACKQVPVCHGEGPDSLVHEVGGRWLAGNAQPTNHSPALAEMRRFIVEAVAAHPRNSLEARQALASLAHEPWHVVRADVLKASNGQVAVSQLMFRRARIDRGLITAGVPLKPVQLSRQKKSVEVVADAVKFVLDMTNALSWGSTYRDVAGKVHEGQPLLVRCERPVKIIEQYIQSRCPNPAALKHGTSPSKCGADHLNATVLRQLIGEITDLDNQRLTALDSILLTYGFESMKVLRQFAGDTLGSLSLARRVDGVTDFVAQSFQRSARSAYVSHPEFDPSDARRANLCPLHAPAVACGNCAVFQLQQMYNALWDLRKCPKSQSDLPAKLSIRHAKLIHYRDVVLEAVMSMCGVAGAVASAGARLCEWLDVLLQHSAWQREVAANNWRKREADQQWKALNPGVACPNPEAVAHLPLVFRLRDIVESCSKQWVPGKGDGLPVAKLQHLADDANQLKTQVESEAGLQSVEVVVQIVCAAKRHAEFALANRAVWVNQRDTALAQLEFRDGTSHRVISAARNAAVATAWAALGPGLPQLPRLGSVTTLPVPKLVVCTSCSDALLVVEDVRTLACHTGSLTRRHNRQLQLDAHKSHLMTVLAHETRDVYLTKRFKELRTSVQDHEAYIVLDYKMKFMASAQMETTAEFYGKAGFSWFGAVVFVREDGDVIAWNVDILLHDRTQDAIQAASCVETLLRCIAAKFGRRITQCRIQCDNAPNLSNMLLYMYYREISAAVGIHILSVSNNEPHCGKDCCDAHFGVVGAYLTRYLDSRGASLKNPEELFNAMVEGVPARTFVEVMEVDQDVTTRVRGVKGMMESYSLPKEFTERQEQVRHVTFNADGSMSHFRMIGQVVPLLHMPATQLGAVAAGLPKASSARGGATGARVEVSSAGRLHFERGRRSLSQRQAAARMSAANRNGPQRPRTPHSRDLACASDAAQLGITLQCPTCKREYLRASGLRQHVCAGHDTRRDRSAVAVGKRLALNLVATLGVGSARATTDGAGIGDNPAEPPTGRNLSLRIGFAAREVSRRKNPTVVRNYLFDAYYKSVQRDPLHPITSEDAYVQLTAAVDSRTGERVCPDWLLVTPNKVKQMMQAFRNRKAVISLLQTRRGAGAGAGAGAAASGV